MKIAYYVITGLLSLGLLFGGFMQLTHNPEMVSNMAKLGYAPYVLTLLGTLKMLAPVAFWVPGFPKVREWAYAGVVFLAIGAIFSHISSNDAAHAGGGAFTLIECIASYILNQKVNANKTQSVVVA
ncbi:MAG: DoxX family protein [Bacteroidota bacterium]